MLFRSLIDANLAEPEEPDDEYDYSEFPETTVPQKKQRKYPQMTVVKELDLHPKGDQSLEDFFKTLANGKQADCIIAFVFYLASTLNMDSGITPNHIYSCFKHVTKLLQNLRRPCSIRCFCG